MICIFAKPPLPGLAKTRLIPILGAQGAASVAGAFLADTVDLALRGKDSIVLATTSETVPSLSLFGLDTSLPIDLWLQGEGSLGDRLECILLRAIKKSEWGLALGADSPDLPLNHLIQALQLLKTNDAVLGPTTDGGYYCLGLKRCPTGLLDNVRWSTPDTFKMTLEALTRADMSVGIAPEWYDVDVPADWDRLTLALKDAPESALKTAKSIRQLSLPRGKGKASEESVHGV